MMLDFLSEYGIPHIVAATKCDKLNATERRRAEETFAAHPSLSAADEIVFFSSKTKEGRDALWNSIEKHCEL